MAAMDGLLDIDDSSDRQRRLGKVRVTKDFATSDTFPFVMALAGFCPVHVDRLMYGGIWVYVGICPLFDGLPEGEIIPEYRLQISTTNGHLSGVEAIREAK